MLWRIHVPLSARGRGGRDKGTGRFHLGDVLGPRVHMCGVILCCLVAQALAAPTVFSVSPEAAPNASRSASGVLCTVSPQFLFAGFTVFVPSLLVISLVITVVFN